VKHLHSLRVAELACNLGHQRAIAVGLVTAVQQQSYDALIIMDADGEDDPAYVPQLLAEHRRNPGKIITAARGERSEGLVFRIFYRLYKGMFRILAGQRIVFGNYALIPSSLAQRLIHRPEIWNNLAAAIIRSKVATLNLWTRRATRYQGSSKMNFVALILHGLSAMSVYSDVVFVRLLLFSLGLAGLALLGILVVVAIRLGTDLAIPGWASVMVAALGVLLAQSIALSFGGIFMVLQNRSAPAVIPAAIAPSYLRSMHTLYLP
jgi:hypothetical protein